MPTVIQLKRIYATPAASDGPRYLVDRLWPRGVSRSNAQLTAWLKQLAPSDELRKAFHTGAVDWPEFRASYMDELRNPEVESTLVQLAASAAEAPISLIYAARNEQQNNAVVLRELLLSR